MKVDLIAKLLATAGITVFSGTRIDWGKRAQGVTIPANKVAIVLHRIDGLPDYHLSGDSGLVESRVQADIWGNDAKSVMLAANALKAAVSGQRFTHGATRFDGIFIADERDGTADDDTTSLFRTSLDLMIHHAAAS